MIFRSTLAIGRLPVVSWVSYMVPWLAEGWLEGRRRGPGRVPWEACSKRRRGLPSFRRCSGYELEAAATTRFSLPAASAHTRMASAVHFSETFDRDNGSCRKRLKLLESDQCLLDTLERNLEVQFVSNSASLVILASSTGCCCCQATLQIQSYVHRLKPSR